MARRIQGLLLVAGILVFSATAANAQAIGAIFGKVTDSTAGVMPGVTVTVAGTGLQQPLVAVTGPTGTYQFQSVPVGTYSVTFELEGFKRTVRPNIIIVAGFQAPVDQKMEVGNKTEEITVSAAPPVVDTKRTTTGNTFTKDVLENIPSARDPWQIINMTPGIQGQLNVGGSSSGQMTTMRSRGSTSEQWALEGGSITDLSSTSAPSYFNFDAFEQIQVTSGGGDVSVQGSGVAVNIVTKSGSNVFKGSATSTFQNDKMQMQNVTNELFNAGTGGFLSGNPIQKLTVVSGEYGGPIKKNRLWVWGSADRQDINVGILNFFDASKGALCSTLLAAQKAGSLAGVVSYGQLNDVQNCLNTDRTLITDLSWKFNYQLNASNKFQYLFSSTNKYRNRRGASSTTAVEATTQQTSDTPKGVGYWGLPIPTHSITHTFIASDRLVFNTMYTYVNGGFYMDYQDVPKQGNCAPSKYVPGATTNADYARDPSCLWNIQSRTNRTTGFSDRSLSTSSQSDRHNWEAKTDGTYFLTGRFGGDHSIKFGAGYRGNPSMDFGHQSGGARVTMQCVGNSQNNCGGGAIVSAGAAAGYVPYQATLSRDTLSNNFWWTYNGYIQDSYNRGKFRINGGLRYDWQNSKYSGGCVAPNVLRPDLLPSACESATSTDPTTGKKVQPFSQVAPRVSVTYDLFGNGKTSIHASFSYYFALKIVVAQNLGALRDSINLTWGPNQSSGACSTTSGASCWNDANKDSVVQVNELTGLPTSSNTRYNTTTGIITPAGNIVDPSTKIDRTREFVIGAQHELIPNLAVGVDFIYRKYDRGTATYSVGYQPGSGNNLASYYNPTPLTYTDSVTGLSAPYYTICTGCVRPSGLASITVTNPGYSTYRGVDFTMNKRFSSGWQGSVAVTLQTNPSFYPDFTYTNPTGIQFVDGMNTGTRYLIKATGAYQLPWDIMLSTNLNVSDGATRGANTNGLTINGPGSVYGGVNAAGVGAPISYSTLNFENAGSTRLKPITLMDIGAQKVLSFRGGKNRLKLMLDAFNIFNTNTIITYSSNNRSLASFSSPATIVPPRIFRVGLNISF